MKKMLLIFSVLAMTSTGFAKEMDVDSHASELNVASLFTNTVVAKCILKVVEEKEEGKIGRIQFVPLRISESSINEGKNLERIKYMISGYLIQDGDRKRGASTFEVIKSRTLMGAPTVCTAQTDWN